MYDESALLRLKEKLDYEIWLLDFLSKKRRDFEGSADTPTITLTNHKPGGHVHLGVRDHLGGSTALSSGGSIALWSTAAWESAGFILSAAGKAHL